MRTAVLCLFTSGVLISAVQSQATQSTEPPVRSAISDNTAKIPDDEAFAGYQRVMKGITPPKATRAPDPSFPELPADAEQRGIVVMLVGVNARGRVEPVRVLRSSNPAFEKSAVATVKTWKFKPARKDGQPIPVQVEIEMKFAK